jgi:hypothetical protein
MGTIVEITRKPQPGCKGDTIHERHTYTEVVVELRSGELMVLPAEPPTSCQGCWDRDFVTVSAKNGKEMKWVNRYGG